MPTIKIAALAIGLALAPMGLHAQSTPTDKGNSVQVRIPKDQYPLMLIQRNRRAIAAYNYKLEFYKLPNRVDVDFRKDRRRAFFREGLELPAGALKPESTMSFRRVCSVFYDPNADPQYFLVLTLPLVHFSSKDPDEKRFLRQTRKPTDAPWINNNGDIDDFGHRPGCCGKLKSVTSG